MRRPSRTNLTIEPKSSSRSTIEDASRATSVPRPPMAIPMCAAFKRRRIVDTVPGHSRDRPVRFECVDDTKLLLRHDPGEHRRRTYTDSQLAVGQLLDLFACHEIFGVEACLARDRSCSRRIVAGDHDHLDASRSAFAHGIGHTRPQRIGKTDELKNLNEKLCCESGHVCPANEARATPKTRRPSAAMASMDRVSAATSGALRWQRSAIASGAPLAAMTKSCLASVLCQTCDIARRPGRSP